MSFFTAFLRDLNPGMGLQNGFAQLRGFTVTRTQHAAELLEYETLRCLPPC